MDIYDNRSKPFLFLSDNNKRKINIEKLKVIKMIKWQESFNVNIKSIDEQHKKLVDILNKMDKSKNEEKKIILETFDELFEYVKYHFSFEEKLMRDKNYSGYAKHKIMHEKIISTLQEYYENFQNKNTENTIDAHTIISFLMDWLLTHIMQKDKLYAKEILTISTT